MVDGSCACSYDNFRCYECNQRKKRLLAMLNEKAKDPAEPTTIIARLTQERDYYRKKLFELKNKLKELANA